MSSYGWLKSVNVKPVLELLLSFWNIGCQSLQKHAPCTLVVGSIGMSISKNVVGFARFLFDCLMGDSDDTYWGTVSKI